jgi:hypothetical protein
VIAFTQEYMRARAAGLGQSDIGAVTIAERPVRASLLFIAFIVFQLKMNLVSTISIVWLGAQLVSLIYLARIYFTSLKSH